MQIFPEYMLLLMDIFEVTNVSSSQTIISLQKAIASVMSGLFFVRIASVNISLRSNSKTYKGTSSVSLFAKNLSNLMLNALVKVHRES